MDIKLEYHNYMQKVPLDMRKDRKSGQETRQGRDGEREKERGRKERGKRKRGRRERGGREKGRACTPDHSLYNHDVPVEKMPRNKKIHKP